MKKTNIQICDNCQKENPLYRETCLECGYYLRKKEPNIDLWSTVWKLFENPKKAIKNIIFAEHKNFVVFLLLLFSVKLYSLFVITKYNLNPLSEEITNSFLNAVILIVSFTILIIIFSWLITFILNIGNKGIVRFKDNIAIITYSFIPIIIISIILLPIEYGIFGKQWFSSNPSPIVVKKNAAYLLYGIESVMILWSVVILYIALFLQSNSKIKALFFMLLFFSMISAVIILFPINIV